LEELFSAANAPAADHPMRQDDFVARAHSPVPCTGLRGKAETTDSEECHDHLARSQTS
jgi:hypothetical protein